MRLNTLVATLTTHSSAPCAGARYMGMEHHDTQCGNSANSLTDNENITIAEKYPCQDQYA